MSSKSTLLASTDALDEERDDEDEDEREDEREEDDKDDEELTLLDDRELDETELGEELLDELLDTLCAMADKGTAKTRKADRERWRGFIVSL
jgi:hypothetical protein